MFESFPMPESSVQVTQVLHITEKAAFYIYMLLLYIFAPQSFWLPYGRCGQRLRVGDPPDQEKQGETLTFHFP